MLQQNALNMGSTAHTGPLATCECPQLPPPGRLQTARRLLWLFSEQLGAQLWHRMDSGSEAWLCRVCPNHMPLGNLHWSSPCLGLLICQTELITVATPGWGLNETGCRKWIPTYHRGGKSPRMMGRDILRQQLDFRLTDHRSWWEQVRKLWEDFYYEDEIDRTPNIFEYIERRCTQMGKSL